MSLLRTSDLEEMTGFSQRYWQKRIANLEPQLKGLTLDMITTARLSEIEQARLARGVTSATVRRDLACLSSLFSRCEEWGPHQT